ncbi:hypothetical protein [Halococcus thailandensis]|uniref:Uncharacterized protein n=1 Tax=Halococcus thailandensis JCM 13552 TaxID=1227457 RepID=M0NGR3_9EURY|nr:hypothetical protein [Halococcus thailandensis]EMA56299.1 hypothetical protein C451_03124 [Halococcus thailandensis JCM 13552]
MEIRQLTLEDAYRELNNIVDVVAVTTDGPGSLCAEHKDVQDAIEEFLNGTTWAIIEITDLAGQYPRAYVGPPPEHREGGR